jgi:dihydrofolate reductase
MHYDVSVDSEQLQAHDCLLLRRAKMTKIFADQSVSLDGFSAGTNVRVGNGLGDNGESLHTWMEYEGFAQVQDALFENGGAVIMGRTMFDVGLEPWGENPPFHMPVFVLTHRAKQPLPMEGGTTYFFVTEGLKDALHQARAAADNKDVIILGGAETIQQFLNTGLIDEVRIHLAHVLLGNGTRLLTPANADAVELECIKLREGKGVTHLTFNVRKKG